MGFQKSISYKNGAPGPIGISKSIYFSKRPKGFICPHSGDMYMYITKILISSSLKLLGHLQGICMLTSFGKGEHENIKVSSFKSKENTQMRVWFISRIFG